MSPELERPAAPPVWRRPAAVLGAVVLAVVVGLAVAVVLRDREQVAAAVGRLGWGPVVVSAVLAAASVVCTRGTWVQALAALGARLPARTAAPVFFLSQLGKYLPGSVWPAVAQMEAGRRAGLARRTMLTANLLTLLVSLAVGGVVACALLPAGSPDALRRYWWLLLALPFLLAALHPRVLPAVVGRAGRLVRRPAPVAALVPSAVLRSAGWATLSWLLLGAHLAVLCAALGATGVRVALLSTGAAALAVCVGVLFLPAPAGAGLREVALLLALAPVLTDGEALAVVLVSRAVLVVVDLALAAASALLLRRPAPSGPIPSFPSPSLPASPDDGSTR